MGLFSDKRILHYFNDDELLAFCKESLEDAAMEPFSQEEFKNADIVLSDAGIPRDLQLPGFVPVVLFIDDETPFPDTYYSRELDPALTPKQLTDELEVIIPIAGYARSMGLPDLKILNTEILESLSDMGSADMVVNGLKRFIKNTTLQLNECRSLGMRDEYDQIRFIMHALKGNAATLGGEQLARLSGVLEDELMSENCANFRSKLDLAYTLLASFSYMSNGWYYQ